MSVRRREIHAGRRWEVDPVSGVYGVRAIGERIQEAVYWRNGRQSMSEELRDLGKALFHNLKVAATRTGQRASASAVKSLAKDGRRFVGALDKKIGKFLDGLEDVLEDDDGAPRTLLRAAEEVERMRNSKSGL
jgi:hypothetical protein